MYIECSLPFWVEVAAKLKEQMNWEPIYWTTGSKYIAPEIIQQNFNNVLYHENYDAVRGIPHPSYKNKALSCIDPDLIREFYPNESILMKMMDRMDPYGVFVLNDRVRLYHQYLRYWTTILDELNPDIIIASASPHLMYDYILYLLAKKRGIPFIMFAATVIPKYIYPISDLMKMEEPLIENYKKLIAQNEANNLDTIELNNTLNEYLNTVNLSYDKAIPYYMVDQIKRKNESNFSNRVKKFLNIRQYPTYFKNKLFPPSVYFPNYYKNPGFDIEEETLDERGCKEYFRFQKDITKRTEKVYEKFASEANFDSPYIYFPLAYQPERTTSPDGDLFVNQLVCIEMIAKNLPLGWKLYVKEHPSQFMHLNQVRYKNLYKDISNLPNTQLISLKINSFKLIDHCKAVGIISGTAGWESILRSKPCLVFGNTYYKGCEGTFSIENLNSLRAAISKIESGYIPDKNKVKLFLKAIELTCTNAYNDSDDFGIRKEENAEQICNALMHYYYKKFL